MLYFTGMRRSELTGLRDTDIDFSGSAIKVTGKRNKQRIIPLTGPFIKKLEEYIRSRNEITGTEKETGSSLRKRGTNCMINMFIT